MTTTPDAIPADCRRAAALVAHYGQANLDGINAILTEAAEADRVTQLILAVLNLYSFLIPELRTPAAMQWMTRAVIHLAQAEEDQ